MLSAMKKYYNRYYLKFKVFKKVFLHLHGTFKGILFIIFT